MKTTTLTLSALVLLMGLAACNKENLHSSSTGGDAIKVTLHANQENGDTRAAIGETSTDSKTAILWSKGDKLSVFDGENANKEFTLTDGIGETSGTFEGEVGKTSDSYIALHPYQSDVTISENRKVIYDVKFKSEQTAVAGSFDPETALMVAKESAEGKLEFKNALGYVMLTPTSDCTKITLKSNRSSDALAGTVGISLASDDGTPTVSIDTEVSDALSSVSISGDIKANTTYYIAVLPAKLTDGFKLISTDRDGNESIKESSKPLEIKRNTVTDLGSVGIPYLSFSAAQEMTFSMTLASSGIGNFNYSVGGSAWAPVISGESVTFGGSAGSLRLRGISPHGTANGVSDCSKISFGSLSQSSSSPVTCTGDIRTLVNWEEYDSADTKDAKFCRLFEGCTILSSIPENLLPATILSSDCYYEMFYGCKGLTSIPEGLLPATSLSSSCYYKMFYGCKGLTTLPGGLLPATSLSEYCYYSMFEKCTGLTSIPEGLLPAMNLEKYCYEYMFANTGIASIPEELLSVATKLKYYCYAYMFQNCEKLSSIPEKLLPATSLASSCYQSMFAGCKGLTTVPEGLLSATTDLKYNCYGYMFKNCRNLTFVPKNLLPATTLESNCYSNMFYGCRALTAAPELPAATLPEKCYSEMFENCTSLTNVSIKATSRASDSLNGWLSGTVPSESDGMVRTLYTYLDLTEGTDYPTGWTVTKLSN